MEIFHAGTRREGGTDRRRRRPRARRHRHAAERWREAQARAYEAVDRDRLAGGFLPPRHRLARRRARDAAKLGLTPRINLSSRIRLVKAENPPPQFLPWEEGAMSAESRIGLALGRRRRPRHGAHPRLRGLRRARHKAGADRRHLDRRDHRRRLCRRLLRPRDARARLAFYSQPARRARPTVARAPARLHRSPARPLAHPAIRRAR